jgi:hemoglobin
MSLLSTIPAPRPPALALTLLLLLWLLASPGARALAQESSPSLYARLGGAPGVALLVDGVIDAAVRDPRTAAYWQRVDLVRVKRQLNAYLCLRAGGACAYENDDMQTIHAGLHIRQDAFYAVVEHLRAALDGQGVGEREKNELLHLLAPLKREVVQP